MKIPVIVVGPYGKALGRPVCRAILESEACAFVGGVTSPNGGVVQRSQELGGVAVAGSFASLARESSAFVSNRDGTVVLYATKGDQVLKRMQEAVQNGFKRHVVGSTDLPPATVQYLKEMAVRGELVLDAPNFSPAATLVDWTAEVWAKVFPGYDAGVTDKHHNRKAGPLSGTALMYARSIARGRGLDPEAVIQRHGARPGAERKESDISVTGHRLGGLPGEHEVYFAGQHDLLVLEQRAYSTVSFALGALLAIMFCSPLSSGPVAGGFEGKVYRMRDVMRLPNPANMHIWT
ncbi:MAG: hypothetical protein HYT31_03185 [Parcubacteria group bacterium]|nr:hypothetical protein [Parcubacteria group bacterium]